MKIIHATLISIFIIFLLVSACPAIESTKMTTISAWTGEYVDTESSLYLHPDDWVHGRTDRGISLNRLMQEGWRVISVIKTNEGAKSFQLMFFLEIDEKQYSATFFGKLAKEPKKIGSDKDL